MTTKDKALKLALEALMRSRNAVSGDLDLAECAYGRNDPDGHRYNDAKKALVTLDKAITALREALAKPDFWEGYVPEPVKPATTETNGGKTGWPPGLLQDDCKGLSKWLSNKPDAKRRVREALDKKAENARELGLDYEPAQQEPVAIALNTGTKQGVKWLKNVEHGEHLYTSPPAQRTWVGLTDEDKHYLNEVLNLQGRFPVIDAIEAKLKEKNNG